MKRLLTLFLVIGVLGIHGQTTEGDIKQQADTIIKADTIGTENLQIEGDTESSIKDSLFTEEIKKDQQEIMEKKESPVSCCLSGKNQSEQKSKWSFGIGYNGAYNYIGNDLRSNYLDYVEWPTELNLGQWLTLYNYWMNGVEVNATFKIDNSSYLEFGSNYGFSNRTDCGFSNLSYENEDSIYEILYSNRTLSKYTLYFLFFKNEKIKLGADIIYSIASGQELLIYFKEYPFKTIDDIFWIYSRPSVKNGLGMALNIVFYSPPIIKYKNIVLNAYSSIKAGQTIEIWNNSKRKEIWGDKKLKINFTGINFGLKINWGK